MAPNRPRQASAWKDTDGHSRVAAGSARVHTFGRLVGGAETADSLFSLLARIATSDATSLVEGESGTGKEASAESIHSASDRRNGPFVVVHCGAIPPQVLERELLGHDGQSGGAGPSGGAFEAAAGGTIFLDEVGELGMELQPKVLRVLERRQVRRLGGNGPIPVDVRVLAGTARNLRTEVAAGRFRSDLYYRLAVVRVRLPPLRDRLADLPILLEHLLTTLGAAANPVAEQLRRPEFLKRLAGYRWPGNVRQLRNYIERVVALGDATAPPNVESIVPPAVTSDALANGSSGSRTSREVALPVKIDVNQPFKEARQEWMRTFERRYLEELLAKHNNNVSAAARGAGLDRIHLYRLLWKHGLKQQANDAPPLPSAVSTSDDAAHGRDGGEL